MKNFFNWLRSLFQKSAFEPEVKERYLFDESAKDLLDKSGTTLISDVANVIIKSNGVAIGEGLGIASGFYLNKDDNDYINSSIIDLQLYDDKYELNLNETYDVQYNTVGYNSETNVVKCDISIILEEAALQSREDVVCHKSKAKIIETERI